MAENKTFTINRYEWSFLTPINTSKCFLGRIIDEKGKETLKNYVVFRQITKQQAEEPSLYMISQTIGTMLFERIPIPELFNKPIINVPKDDGQLDLFRDLKS